MFEIELKAHLADRTNCELQLETFTRFSHHADKDDVYWTLIDATGKKTTLRIRKETDKSPVATFKKKEVRKKVGSNAGYEVNDEKEFIVSDSDALESFLQSAGFRISNRKHKITDTYYYTDEQFGQIAIELSEVGKLGNFIEIEILSKEDDDETTKAARKKLMEILDRCEVPDEAIETRYYNELLQAENN